MWIPILSFLFLFKRLRNKIHQSCPCALILLLFLALTAVNLPYLNLLSASLSSSCSFLSFFFSLSTVLSSFGADLAVCFPSSAPLSVSSFFFTHCSEWLLSPRWSPSLSLFLFLPFLFSLFFLVVSWFVCLFFYCSWIFTQSVLPVHFSFSTSSSTRALSTKLVSTSLIRVPVSLCSLRLYPHLLQFSPLLALCHTATMQRENCQVHIWDDLYTLTDNAAN